LPKEQTDYPSFAIYLSVGKKFDPSSAVIRILPSLINPSYQNTCNQAIFEAGKEAKGASAGPRGQAKYFLSSRSCCDAAANYVNNNGEKRDIFPAESQGMAMIIRYTLRKGRRTTKK
jgi:hypothetical protein